MKKNLNINLIDCTLRDGGYYNNWDFSSELVAEYLEAMASINIDFVEIGFRFIDNEGFKGGHAYSTDEFINSLSVPNSLKDKIGVMVNGADLLPSTKISKNNEFQEKILNKLFQAKVRSPVSLVRIACSLDNFEDCLPAAKWLKIKGYLVGFNLMHINNYSKEKIQKFIKKAHKSYIDILYFADSMGSLDTDKTKDLVECIKDVWDGELGIHTHDNMGKAVANTLEAIKGGVTWVDSTVTGMGRGAGNAQIEYLILALAEQKPSANPTKLLELIRKHFMPLQQKYGWGINPYYYLAGKFNIHPTFIQEMLSDKKFSDEDIIAVIDQLKVESGQKFNLFKLDAARLFYKNDPVGTWDPFDLIKGRDVLILGTGPSASLYKDVIETFIEKNKPFVIALNSKSDVKQELIDVRAACHPVRLLADCHEYSGLDQPLITPATMLPENIKALLKGKKILDYGIEIREGCFQFNKNYCTIPSSLVIAYALAIASCGKAKSIFLAGFDGYSADDSRRKEMDVLLKAVHETKNVGSIISITPTKYEITTKSVYAMLGQT